MCPPQGVSPPWKFSPTSFQLLTKLFVTAEIQTTTSSTFVERKKKKSKVQAEKTT